MCLPISSKRSTHTTNTFVSGPSGGKDFPVDDLFVFTKGLSYRNSTKHSIFKLIPLKIKIIVSAVSIQQYSSVFSVFGEQLVMPQCSTERLREGFLF